MSSAEAAALTGQAARRRKRGRLTVAVAISVLAHLLVLFLLFGPRPQAPPIPQGPTIRLALLPGQGPDPSPSPDRQPIQAPASAPATSVVQPSQPHPPRPRPASARAHAVADATSELAAGSGEAAAGDSAALGEGDVADARTASSGGGGGARCDMAARVQAALRKDVLVQAAVRESQADGARARALWVWNGDWVASHGQDGRGLAAAREAIAWEIAFAPEECRHQVEHGLVLVSLDDQGQLTPLVIGEHATWRWSDLVLARVGP